MKKSKPKIESEIMWEIEPEIMWAAWNPECGFVEGTFLTRKRLIESYFGSWDHYKRYNGYRAVKVEIREAKNG